MAELFLRTKAASHLYHRDAITRPRDGKTLKLRTNRRRLALKGKELTAKERKACCHLVRPETILAWYRQLGARKYDSSRTRTAGRPRKPDHIRSLVLRLANENLGWGYTKIRDALRGLKIEIGRTTVARCSGIDARGLGLFGAMETDWKKA